jgi:hypothetical protein
VLEMVRTGIVAMRRGGKSEAAIASVPAGNGAEPAAPDDNVSYSV